MKHEETKENQKDKKRKHKDIKKKTIWSQKDKKRKHQEIEALGLKGILFSLFLGWLHRS